MSILKNAYSVVCLAILLIVISGCGSSHVTTLAPVQVSVAAAGTGAGTVSSTPAGISCGTACSASFTVGTAITLTATPDASSTFAGWSGACSGTGACSMVASADASVTATFNVAVAPAVQLNVALAGTGGGSVTSAPAGITCGTTCSANFPSGTAVTLTAAPNTGSTFTGWSGACTGTGTCTVNLTATAAVTATFDTQTVTNYALTVVPAGTGSGSVSSSPAGITCGSTCAANFASGTAVTLTATPNAGSTFGGWSGGGCTGTGTCTVNLTAATTVTATFNPVVVITYQLSVVAAGTGAGSVTSSPAGITCGTTCSASFPSGTVVTLTATANAGSTFAGFTGGGCTGTGTCAVTMSAATSVTATFNLNYQLTVVAAGTGAGSVSSAPAGITCGTTCSASFASGTTITLTATANSGSTFAGFTGGGCTGNSTLCTVTLTSDTSVTATFNPSGNVTALNHIVFLAQENRSFDHYFGALRGYWATKGYPDQSFDGLAQFNPTTGQAPLQGPAPSVPGCDPTIGPPADCSFSTANPVASYHLLTECTENTSPSWDESHVNWDYNDQLGLYPPTLDGFVYAAAHDARNNTPQPFTDISGIRAMGYYNESDLNYYYFMASNFATSDRWFHPVMTRTSPNREYLIAATSQGRVYPNGTNAQDQSLLTATTIFEELQNAGITWKIYVDPTNNPCTPATSPQCLMDLSYVKNFTFSQTILSKYPNNIAPISQYYTDLQNGTLPQVAQIESATNAGADEHPSTSDASPTDIQTGANYVSNLINGLMTSTSWKDSAFILTYDEYGGLYDHVPPQPTVSPDGIKPVDQEPLDQCAKYTGPVAGTICDFTYTGYRVPLIVVSPFTKKNYVSHTTMDFTAILKLIETRFNVSALTKRDAAQPDMTDFFDFVNPPWVTPPSPPAQLTNGLCYMTHLP